MTITLDHTIVPAHDKEKSARFFAEIFGLKLDSPIGHFAAVHVNDKLTLDFADREDFESHHYAFHVSDEEFDAISHASQKWDLNIVATPCMKTKVKLIIEWEVVVFISMILMVII